MHSIPIPRIIATFCASLPALVFSQVLPAEIVPLSEVEIVEAKNNSGYDPRGYEHRIHGYKQQLYTDKLDTGDPIKIADAEFSKGYHVTKPKTSWKYELGGNYLSLTGQLGTIKGRADGRTMVLEVHGDGNLLFRSAPLDKAEAKPLFVDLRGVNSLEMMALDAGGAKQEDLVLGDPILTKAPETETPPEGVPGKEAGNAPPKPVITAEPEDGRVPLTVDFNSEKSTDADGTIMRYTWHFGDGETEFRDFNTSHTYQLPGIYEVALVAEDEDEGRGVTRKQVIVRPAENMRPRATFTADQWLARPGESVTLDAGESRDRDGKIAKYEWAFPDGSTAEGVKVEKAFDEIGLHVIDLTVTDSEGETDTISRRVRVDDGSNASIFPIRDGARIMTIGNSLLGGLKSILDAFAAAADPPLTIHFGGAGKGAGKVDEYVNYEQLQVREKIMEGYDIVLIQPWTRPYQDDWEEVYKPNVKTLVEWVRESGAYPVIYMPHSGYRGQPDQQLLGHERIGGYAEELGVGYIPAGLAWAQVAKDHPRTDDERRGPDPEKDYGFLYGDGIHQSATGQLLTAMGIWHYLTGESPLEMNWPTDEQFGHLAKKIDKDRAPYLRETAAKFSQPAEALQE